MFVFQGKTKIVKPREIENRESEISVSELGTTIGSRKSEAEIRYRKSGVGNRGGKGGTAPATPACFGSTVADNSNNNNNNNNGHINKYMHK